MIQWVNDTVNVDILNGSHYITDLLYRLMDENNLNHKKRYFSNKKLIEWGIENEKWIL